MYTRSVMISNKKNYTIIIGLLSIHLKLSFMVRRLTGVRYFMYQLLDGKFQSYEI